MKKEIENRITEILTKAFNDGRTMLFEHEVYAVLKIFNIEAPVHQFVLDEENITAEILKQFGSKEVVLKAVAADVTHKEVLGGVKVVFKDLDFVKYSAMKMRQGFHEKGISLSGILLVEYIEYSRELGNEALLGFRESDAFGPVISFTKGGSDAEHFARYFSEPNLILAPIDGTWARALLESTKIKIKYEQEGKSGHISKIVETEVALSELATAYSNFFESDTPFVIREFEVNPFVFDAEGRFIALDGFASFEKRTEPPIVFKPTDKNSVAPFFEPSGVAVIGVSATDSGKTGNIIVRNLLAMERCDIYCVNIKGGEIPFYGNTYPIYKSISDIEERIDLAVITVPAGAVPPVMEDCVKKGVKAVILIPGGFSETGKNEELEERIIAMAKEKGIRIIGPNCLGVFYSCQKDRCGVNTFFVPEEKFAVNVDKGTGAAILSQSGALGITEIYNLRDAISPKVVVSYGNQLDIDPSDLIDYFNDDPFVSVIACYIEGFKTGGGRKFFNIAKKSAKPVIVYKAGRTEAGRKATESHTASIAGEYAVARAAMKQAGLIVADTMLDHGDFLKTFAMWKDVDVTGNRLAIIANAGYEKTLAADNIGGLVPACFDKETEKALGGILPPFVNVEPFLDLTPMADDEMFEKCIDITLKSESVDALFISIVPHSGMLNTSDEEIKKNKRHLGARIVNLTRKYNKPVAVSVNVVSGVDAVFNEFGRVFDKGGIPTFLTANRAMTCLNAFIRYHMIKKDKSAFKEWLV